VRKKKVKKTKKVKVMPLMVSETPLYHGRKLIPKLPSPLRW
jgi:hypothetical protein